MQTFAPYINLGRGNADPDPTILMRKHTFPITAFLPLLFKSHYVSPIFASSHFEVLNSKRHSSKSLAQQNIPDQ